MQLVELLQSRGIDTNVTRIVRHAVQSRPYIQEIIRLGHFDLYQATQKTDIFKNTAYFLSFKDLEGTKALLHGFYQINSVKQIHVLPPVLASIGNPERWTDTNPPYYQYNIEKLDTLADLEQRLVINWGSATRSWYQTKLDKEVIEILPSGFFKPFPGYNEVILSYAELATVINNPEANRQWKVMLSNVFGVYLNLNKQNGQQYIGSASGKDGFWGRWSEYADTKHGNNIALIELLSKEPDRYIDFQFSILSVLPNSTLKADVTRLESVIKEKLGSRSFGLNEN